MSGAHDTDGAAAAEGRRLLLYDGTCGLCHGLVRFLVRRDRADALRFAALQSDLGRRTVTRHGLDPEVLDTLYLVDRPGEPDERALVRGRAAVAALTTLGGPWRAAGVLRALPRPLLDLGYRLIARVRYRIFGRRACELPAPEARHKFVA